VRSVDELRTALAEHAPQPLNGRRRAAVAVVVLEQASGPELLFIERARRASDPWSGQMAFPGGRMSRHDLHPRAAAERETLEEVGVDLSKAELLGQLHDLQAGVRVVSPLVLSAFVYRIGSPPPLTLNHEVHQALWVPAATLTNPRQYVDHRWGPGRFPGIVVGDPDRHVVWGLTYQLVGQLFSLVGVRLPTTTPAR
jgi:8-oxo-dGTP pyrophosphatase MutT (NUDIX family)